MAAPNFESLNFEITVNASNAATEVNSLARALRGLKTAMDGLGNFGQVGRRMKGVAKQAEDAARRVSKATADITASVDKGASSGALSPLFFGGASDTTIRRATDDTMDLASAMNMVRGAMGSVGADYRTFGQSLAFGLKGQKAEITRAADEIGVEAAKSIQQSLTREMISKAYSFELFGQGKSWNIGEDYARAIDEMFGKAAPKGEDLVGWLRAGRSQVAAEGAEIGRIAGEEIRKSMALHVQGGVDNSNGPVDARVFQSFGAGIGGSLRSTIEELKTFKKVTETLDTVTEKLTPALQGAGVAVEGFGAAMTAAAGPISAVIIAIQVAVKVATFLVDQFNEFIGVLQKFRKAVDQFKERFSPFEKMKKELASILALAKRQILRRAINAVIKAITEGFKTGVDNLAKYDAEFAAVIHSFHNALGLFKNSIAVAVAPILSYFIPAINTLLAALTRAMNTLARLTALLTGKHTYTVAKDYEAIEDSAGGASSAVKELQRTILGFDEINRLNRPSGSGSGGGGGAGDGISAYETMEVGDWPYDSWGEALEAFLEWLNDTGVPNLKTGLGNVASAVNEFAQNFYDAFTYEGVQEQISELGKNVAQALNDFLVNGEGSGGINWTTLGNAIGAAVKSLFNFSGNFFRTFDFMGLGSSFAETFNAALQQITPEDVNNIADTVFGILTSGIQVAMGFLMNVNLADLGFKAGEFVNRIVEGLEKLFGGSTGQKGGPYYSNLEIVANNIAAALVNFFDTVNWGNLFSTLSNIVTSIMNGLETIIKSLMANKEFMNALRSFMDFMAKTAVRWFVLKLKFYAQATSGFNIWRTLISGWSNFDTTESFTGDGVYDSLLPPTGFSSDIEEATDAITDLTNASGKGRPVIEDAASSITTLGSNAGDASIVIAQSSKDISDDFGSIGTAAKGANSTVYSQMLGTSGVTSRLSKTATDSVKPVSDFNKTIGDIGTAAKNAATEVKKQTIGNTGSVVAFMKTMKTDASDHIDKLKKNISDKLGDAATSASNSATSIKNSIVGAVGGAKTALAGYKFNDVGGNIKNGIIDGMGDFYGKLDQWAAQFKNRILQNFKIKSPSRWARDMVGEYITEGIAEGMLGSSAVEQACYGLKEGIASQFNEAQFFGGVSASTGRGIDIASAIGNQVASGVASIATGDDDRQINVNLYLDGDKLATVVTRKQQAQNRRYSTTAMA